MDAKVLAAIGFFQRQAASLLLYQDVLSGKIAQTFGELLAALSAPTANPIAILTAYGAWFAAQAAAGQSWQEYLLREILQADNPFSQQAQRLELGALNPALLTAVQHDLRSLQQLYHCEGDRLSQWVQQATGTTLPSWERQDGKPHGRLRDIRQLPLWIKLEGGSDWGEAIADLAQYYRKAGIGIFARHHAMRWQAGKLIGIAYPDPIRLHELIGYESQQAALVQNTQALLAGYPALHVLLYGSRGTGKSSLIKALLHRFGDRGLRLIEVAKADLQDLQLIIEQVRHSPQKFILFVDDLSFEEDEDAYKALKVVLEGNLTARSQNVVVYATSNRRHLIREFFGDRPRPRDADEVHAWDTVQEKLSFSDRFGLTLTFEPADQDTYLQMVRHLAQLAHLTISPAELDRRALQWATQHNGRSGRTARQFIDFLQSDGVNQTLQSPSA
ncbi:ATP-binding protein [Microcoleus sp. FACHB-1515]|uniref:ATP-binding protein n=1 Tax=Cyanophyceae TaxID=3028117 RepID=UPI0016868519|nr:ATP-binding protein [Microcoleus sp. FACHB-1515]MBD2091483.1 ATP-binding protein [Microcoleus sp. FACHB-1515]